MTLLRFLLLLLVLSLAGCASWPAFRAEERAAAPVTETALLSSNVSVDLWAPLPAWYPQSLWDSASPWQKQADYVTAQPDYLTAQTTDFTVDLTRPPGDVWERIRRGFAIPNLHGELTDKWTTYYASHPELVQRMAQRAGKFLYHIVDALEQQGLPTELALLPFVESAYNPMALSSARASGLWQFMPATGRQYQLTQDWWRDQRRDPIASTRAAMDYLSYLYEFQGDWHLALASYNWGEGSVRRAVERNTQADLPTDYTALDMPEETRNYIPKLQAFKNIVADPEKYGITLPHVADVPYFVTVQKTRTLDVAVAAKLANMPLAEFIALNPSYQRPVIPGAHKPVLLLPVDRAEVFESNLADYQGQLSTWVTYQAKSGESYAAIAKRYGMTLAQLRQVNGLEPQESRAQGQTLLVPARRGVVQLAGLGLLPRNRSVRTHMVKPGDVLSVIAKRYGTTVRALQRANNLKGTRIIPGRRLQIPAPDRRG